MRKGENKNILTHCVQYCIIGLSLGICATSVYAGTSGDIGDLFLQVSPGSSENGTTLSSTGYRFQGNDITDNTVSSDEFAPGAIQVIKFSTGSIDEGRFDTGAVESVHILDGTIQKVDVGSGFLDSVGDASWQKREGTDDIYYNSG